MGKRASVKSSTILHDTKEIKESFLTEMYTKSRDQMIFWGYTGKRDFNLDFHISTVKMQILLKN